MKSYSLKFKYIVIILNIIFILFPTTTLGAILYLEPSSEEYQLNDTFIVEMKIDSEDECINTIKANLSFSNDILKAIDFSQGGSFLILWVQPPKIDQGSGIISFTGGIPGGYCGILPGDPGESNLLGKIIFQSQEVEWESGHEIKAKVEFLDTSQVLLNDGLGTPAELTTKGAVFTILPKKMGVTKDEWQEELKKDTIPPELFQLEIHQDLAIFEGKYFIIFFTTDKQTGIDYYELKEGEKDWRETSSPYLLEDQDLRSIIKVKAIDKAGNERIAEFIPPEKPFPYWIIILILLGTGVICWIIWKFRNK